MKKVFSFSGVVDMEMTDLQIGDINSPHLMCPKSTTNYKALTDTMQSQHYTNVRNMEADI